MKGDRMDSGLNYRVWMEDYREFLEKLPGKTVFVLYSGGKDSSVALHFLQKASEELNFNFEIHAAIYPHHVLTANERFRLDQYWKNRGLFIVWHNIPETDDKLSDALNNGVNPCLVCNTSKKTNLGKYFKAKKIPLRDLTIVISYSLWDLVSATVEHILGNVYCSTTENRTLIGKSPEERFTEIAQRFYPYLTMEGGLTVLKPLIYYNDDDILNVISEENIPVTIASCNFKKYRPKRLFAEYYKAQGLQFNFQNVLEFAKKNLGLPSREYFYQFEGKDYLKKML